MSVDVRPQLQSALGGAYRLDRELGGGGMSRVFVAEDTALGRTVVVKLLPEDLAADVSVDRFKREILLAAKLQHPHIVPVLHAGEMDGLPYFTMPFVDGESLRARLARGPLPLTEAIGVLRDVAKALAYAHERGVVHRDIKPDNVMLSGGSAVVADFGIAKALVASRARQDLGPAPTLTSLGTSIGTPTYMAPEQAAGDPDTDHRADIYAFGCMAYELLAGRPPFHGMPPQKLLAAHMAETAPPVAELRRDTPPLLAALIARCLQKDPADRPAHAADIVRVLETVTSGSGHQAMPSVLLGGRHMTRKALALWAVAFMFVLLVARIAVTEIGLPSWVLPGSAVVMLLGLPVILFTAYVQRATRIELTEAPVLTPGGTRAPRSTIRTFALRASPHVSWRATALGGGWALAGFALLIAGFMILRGTGLGPFGSLLAAGKIAERDRILVAEFSGDSTLGAVVSEGVRTGLSQSSVLSVVPPNLVAAALRRMERPATSRVDEALAREIARREGIKALVVGDVRPLGTGYVVTMRLVGSDSGQTLASITETADSPRQLIDAIGTLTNRLRARVGESLKRVNRTAPLANVTTASLPALEKYTLGVQALSTEGDVQRGVRLLEEAIELDTTFAMAYRRLAIELRNNFGQSARYNELIRRAYQYRHRLTDVERYNTEGSYYLSGANRDLGKALAAYENLLTLQPDNFAALNNAALIHGQLRDNVRSEEYYRKALAANPAASSVYTNLATVLVANGKPAEADSIIRELRRVAPSHYGSYLHGALLLAERGQLDSAGALLEELRRERGADPAVRTRAVGSLFAVAELRGRLSEARALGAELAVLDSVTGRSAAARLVEQLELARMEAWQLERPAAAVTRLDAALATYPLASIPLADQPLEGLAYVYALAGRTDRVKAIHAAFLARERAGEGVSGPGADARFRGGIAFAEQRYADAARLMRESDVGECRTCALPMLAWAYDLNGQADSAAAVMQRYLDTRYLFRWATSDPMFRPAIHKRLGELYEAQGDTARAASQYAKFIELWQHADPELQPKVREARARLQRLTAGKG